MNCGKYKENIEKLVNDNLGKIRRFSIEQPEWFDLFHKVELIASNFGPSLKHKVHSQYKEQVKNISSEAFDLLKKMKIEDFSDSPSAAPQQKSFINRA